MKNNLYIVLIEQMLLLILLQYHSVLNLYITFSVLIVNCILILILFRKLSLYSELDSVRCYEMIVLYKIISPIICFGITVNYKIPTLLFLSVYIHLIVIWIFNKGIKISATYLNSFQSNNLASLNNQKYSILINRFFALILLALFTPLLIIIYIAIKLSGVKEPLFLQERLGYKGESFTILKFKTLNQDLKMTKIGRYLRVSNLDELPQLLNIIKGEMAFVGPRPEISERKDFYSDIALSRLLCKQGLTGLWQISCCKAFPIEDNIQYDLYYIKNKTILLDVSIILLTPISIITEKIWK